MLISGCGKSKDGKTLGRVTEVASEMRTSGDRMLDLFCGVLTGVWGDSALGVMMFMNAMGVAPNFCDQRNVASGYSSFCLPY